MFVGFRIIRSETLARGVVVAIVTLYYAIMLRIWFLHYIHHACSRCHFCRRMKTRTSVRLKRPPYIADPVPGSKNRMCVCVASVRVERACKYTHATRRPHSNGFRIGRSARIVSTLGRRRRRRRRLYQFPAQFARALCFICCRRNRPEQRSAFIIFSPSSGPAANRFRYANACNRHNCMRAVNVRFVYCTSDRARHKK